MHFKFTCFFVHLSVYLQIHLLSGCNQDSSEEFLNLRDWNKWLFLYRISSVEFNKSLKRTFVDWNIYVHLFALRTVYIIYSCKCFMMLCTVVHFLTLVSHHPTVDFYVCLQMTNIHYSWFINKCSCTVYV